MNFYVERGTFDDDADMSSYSSSNSPKNLPSYGINKTKSTLGPSKLPHPNMKQIFHSTPIAGSSNHAEHTEQRNHFMPPKSSSYDPSLRAQEMKKLQSQSQDIKMKVFPGYVKDIYPAARHIYHSTPIAGPSNHVQFKPTLGQSVLVHQNMKQLHQSTPISRPSHHVQFKPMLGRSILVHQNMKQLHQSAPIARPSNHVQLKPTLGQSIRAHQNMKQLHQSTPIAGPSNHVQFKPTLGQSIRAHQNMKQLHHSTPIARTSNHVQDTVQENHFRSPYSSLHEQQTRKLQSQSTAETLDLITRSIQDNSSIAKDEEMKLIAGHAASGQGKGERNSSQKAATSSRKARSKKLTDLAKYDPEAYRKKRDKNNEACKRSRQNNKIKEDENRLKLAEAIERNSRIHAELDMKYKELSELEYMIALIDGEVEPREDDLIDTEEVLDVEQIAVAEQIGDAAQIVIDLDDFSESDDFIGFE